MLLLTQPNNCSPRSSLLTVCRFGEKNKGKNLEYGLKEEGLLSFVRELNGNAEEPYDNYLRDASMYARGKHRSKCDRQRSWWLLNWYTQARVHKTPYTWAYLCVCCVYLCLMQTTDWNSQLWYCRCEVIWCENLCWPLMHLAWPKATGHFSMWKYFRWVQREREARWRYK